MPPRETIRHVGNLLNTPHLSRENFSGGRGREMSAKGRDRSAPPVSKPSEMTENAKGHAGSRAEPGAFSESWEMRACSGARLAGVWVPPCALIRVMSGTHARNTKAGTLRWLPGSSSACPTLGIGPWGGTAEGCGFHFMASLFFWNCAPSQMSYQLYGHVVRAPSPL